MSRVCASCLFLFLSQCVIAQDLPQDERTKIREVLMQQEAHWNTGNIEDFMQGYWQSDSLVFIGSEGLTYGWQTTLDNYRKRYPNRDAMGQLTFTVLKLEALGEGYALLLGKWYLQRKVGDIGGHFSLIWKKIDGKWYIITDHTS